MKKIVLHIGAGKCGSSALQAHLSNNPCLKSSIGESLFYGALGGGGEILVGHTVKEEALCSVFQYSSSVNLSNFEGADISGIVKSSIDSIDCDVLVLSCEGWIYQNTLAKNVFGQLHGYEVEILVYVRPPVEWLNSAWWQWGAWANIEFDRWLEEVNERTHWVKYVNDWSELAFVDKVSVRLLSNDIIQDFHDLLDVDVVTESRVRSNTSLPGSVLRLFQEHSDLRASPHDPTIDFSLCRRLGDISSRPDWVIDSDSVEALLDSTKSPNLSLLGKLDSVQAQSMENDDAWWSGDFYKNKYTQTPSIRTVSSVEKDELLYQAIKALKRTDAEIISLKNRLRNINRKYENQISVKNK